MNRHAETGETGMSDGVRRYRDEMDSEHRPLLDRLHQVIVATCPDTEATLSYGMPAYRVGRRRLNIGAWKHGLSLYTYRRPGTAASRRAIPSWPREREPSD